MTLSFSKTTDSGTDSGWFVSKMKGSVTETDRTLVWSTSVVRPEVLCVPRRWRRPRW